MTSWPNIVTLGGVLLDCDDPGSFRVVESLTGWDDAPGARSGLRVRTQQDGAWDATGFANPRDIEVSGLVEEATPQAAYAVQRQLAALRPQSVLEVVVVNAALGALSSWARVTSSVNVQWLDDTTFTYSVTVTAPDPLKYGPPSFGRASLSTSTPGAGLTYPLAYPLDYSVAAGVTPGAVSVPNTGSAPYWTRMRIDGPVTNPTISLVETGAWVRFNGTLLTGQWLDLDMGARRVLLNGQVSVRQSVSSSGDWLSVPPGGGSITWTADTADPASLLSVWSYEGACS